MKDRAASGFTRELRVHHFIRPGSECARPIHFQQHVCAATPAPAVQVGLDDRSCAGSHCAQRSFEAARVVKTTLIGQYLEPTVLQMIQVRCFMPQSALGENINRRILPVWPFDVSPRGEKVQRRQMPACQVFGEVARRKPKQFPVKSHLAGRLLYRKRTFPACPFRKGNVLAI